MPARKSLFQNGNSDFGQVNFQMDLNRTLDYFCANEYYLCVAVMGHRSKQYVCQYCRLSYVCQYHIQGEETFQTGIVSTGLA